MTEKNIIGSKWVFQTKLVLDGGIDCFKDQLPAHGYSQEPGVNFNEVFTCVVRYNSIRSVLTIANQLDYIKWRLSPLF